MIAPADLIAGKVIAYHQRRGRPKSGTDWRDLGLLLLTFPDLKRDPGPVRDRLVAAGADPPVMAVWAELVAQEIEGDLLRTPRRARRFLTEPANIGGQTKSRNLFSTSMGTGSPMTSVASPTSPETSFS